MVDVVVRAATWIDVDAIEVVVDGVTVDTITIMPGDADPTDATIRYAKQVPIQTAATGGFVVIAAYGDAPLEPVHDRIRSVPTRLRRALTRPQAARHVEADIRRPDLRDLVGARRSLAIPQRTHPRFRVLALDTDHHGLAADGDELGGSALRSGGLSVRLVRDRFHDRQQRRRYRGELGACAIGKQHGILRCFGSFRASPSVDRSRA
jgi:hypothetical protein